MGNAFLYNKDIHAQNVSSSIIKNVSYSNDMDSISDDMIALTEDEYVSKTVSLATNIGKLVFYKEHLRDMFLKSMDINKFIKEYENTILSIV